MTGYLVLVDGARYGARAETAALAEQRVRAALGSAGELVHASRRLTDDVLDHFQEDGPGWQDRIIAALRKAAGDEPGVLQLNPGEVNPAAIS
jgi:uncharacterized protein (DUF4415 family)